MKTLAILLMMGQYIEFTSDHKQAQVCRYYSETGYLECSKPMGAKEAHEQVIKHNRLKGNDSLLVYSWHPVIEKKPCEATGQRQKEGK